jgi:hypothetical protein
MIGVTAVTIILNFSAASAVTIRGHRQWALPCLFIAQQFFLCSQFL